MEFSLAQLYAAGKSLVYVSGGAVAEVANDDVLAVIWYETSNVVRTASITFNSTKPPLNPPRLE